MAVLPAIRLHRIAVPDRGIISVFVDGRPVQGFDGDTLLTVLMTSMGAVRRAEFADEDRGGFCCMGACQDCWVSLGDGRRVRACTTFAEPDMQIMTGRATP